MVPDFSHWIESVIFYGLGVVAVILLVSVTIMIVGDLFDG